MRMTQRVARRKESRRRMAGEPTSSNGASSFHLHWELAPIPLLECSAVLEVLVPPSVPRLYFWALQVDFAAADRLCGSAHLGLQWNRRHPGSTAANWGGYRPDGSQLGGSDPALPAIGRDMNTVAFPWVAGHRYELRIARRGPGPKGGHAWAGSVTDLESGEEQTVRDLHSAGEHLLRPVVWSEVFARCEHPTVAVRWSSLRAVTADGNLVRPAGVRVGYQAEAAGGCSNTTAGVDQIGVMQITDAARRVPRGVLLPIPGE